MSTAVVDSGGEMLNGSKTEGAMADQLDLVIHSFERAIGDSPSSPSQDAVEMGPQPANQFFERLEPGAHGRMHPALQMLLGPGGLTVGPEELESFLEVVSAHEGCIPANQSRKTLLFLGPQLPGILQQQEARLLEASLFATTEPAHFVPPNLVQRPVQMLHQMKAVEENLSIRSLVSDRLEVSLPHVQADHPDGGRAAPPELAEEAAQSFLAAIFTTQSSR